MRAKVRVRGKKGESLNSLPVSIIKRDYSSLMRVGGKKHFLYISQKNITLKCFPPPRKLSKTQFLRSFLISTYF